MPLVEETVELPSMSRDVSFDSFIPNKHASMNEEATTYGSPSPRASSRIQAKMGKHKSLPRAYLAGNMNQLKNFVQSNQKAHNSQVQSVRNLIAQMSSSNHSPRNSARKPSMRHRKRKATASPAKFINNAKT